ncbi:MAG TPA: CPXCG motif-containing cysteine-rich protein [Verrucomicrobiae bacterium]|nr:CPXCG motif-containing cysteine-rich protein [Verrucomicrobiae bacterium]
MNEFLTITCPNCGEEFNLPFDPTEGRVEFVADCEVCCRPISVAVRVRGGEVEELRVSAG